MEGLSGLVFHLIILLFIQGSGDGSILLDQEPITGISEGVKCVNTVHSSL